MLDSNEGKGAAGENSSWKCVVSSSSSSRRLSGSSHGGGMMFILLCLLSNKASQSGRVVRVGGIRGLVGPWLRSPCQNMLVYVVKLDV